MGTPRDYSLTFTAAGQRTLPASGRFCRVLAADASGATIAAGATGSGLLRYTGQDVDAGAAVNEWQISVTVACTVRVCISDTRQADNTASINATVSATVSPGGTMTQPGDVACANGAATQVIAGNADRLAVTVKAPESATWTAGTVRIGTTSVGAASGLELNPGDAYTAAFTGPLYVYNNSGASIDVQVLELGK